MRIVVIVLVILTIVILLLTSGCVMAKKGDLWYVRFGDQKIEGLYIEADGSIVELNKQKSETEFFKYLIELGMKMPKLIP